ncbi:MAG: hypothetical protein MJE77_04135 [Proteobacteria bacterium]|nr:hypothetical protein [Pseudomonadota bacterium]
MASEIIFHDIALMTSQSPLLGPRTPEATILYNAMSLRSQQGVPWSSGRIVLLRQTLDGTWSETCCDVSREQVLAIDETLRQMSFPGRELDVAGGFDRTADLFIQLRMIVDTRNDEAGCSSTVSLTANHPGLTGRDAEALAGLLRQLFQLVLEDVEPRPDRDAATARLLWWTAG